VRRSARPLFANPQQALPLAKVAFEAQAVRDPEACDDTPLGLLATTFRLFRRFADTPSGTDRDEKRIGRVRRVSIEVES
jgi:hypothetical protein